MKTVAFSFFFLPLAILGQVSLKSPLKFLALGDSYTIGQSVPQNQRWPAQLSDSLVSRGIITDTVRIIATTGWRTDDLLNAISGQNLESKNYNLVSLLIGVNNQYQGKPFSQYVTEFPALLDSAVRYAGGDKSHVFIVSIPDYAYTPVGQQSSNPSQISNEIDQYNLYNKQVADSVGITYIDITAVSRQGLTNPALVANDGLHPSGIQYAQWVKLMLDHMHPEILTAIPALEMKDGLRVTIYPNPAKESITLSLPGIQSDSEYLFQLYDATGSLILSRMVTMETFKIKFGQLPQGFYTCKVSSGNTCTTKKIVIN